MKLYFITKEQTDQLSGEDLVNALRINVLYMIQQAGSGHIGSAFSALPIIHDLYYNVMEPEDVFFSSKGHDCAALYAVLMARGVIPFDEIHNFRRPGGLPGHPHPEWPGIPFHTGSLGMGMSKAVGMALADRFHGRKRKIYVLVGDGELQEGQCDEAFRSMAGFGLLDCIRVVVDHNKYQCDDTLITYGRIASYSIPNNLIIHDTHKGLWEPFHAGALSEEDYKRAVREIMDKLPKDLVASEVEQRKRSQVERANALVGIYTEIVNELMREKRNLVLCSADLAKDCGIYRFKDSRRFFEFGIAEQDMVSAAGAMARGGLLPIVHSFACFLTRRANEQIYNNCCEGDRVIYVGAMAGIIPPGPGPTHECLDDIALMKTMPGMTVLDPHNWPELDTAMRWAVHQATGPVYVRIPCLPTLEGMRR